MDIIYYPKHFFNEPLNKELLRYMGFFLEMVRPVWPSAELLTTQYLIEILAPLKYRPKEPHYFWFIEQEPVTENESRYLWAPPRNGTPSGWISYQQIAERDPLTSLICRVFESYELVKETSEVTPHRPAFDQDAMEHFLKHKDKLLLWANPIKKFDQRTEHPLYDFLFLDKISRIAYSRKK